MRKLMTDWLDTPLQQAAAERPDEYRDCRRIAFELREGKAFFDNARTSLRVVFTPISSIFEKELCQTSFDSRAEPARSGT